MGGRSRSTKRVPQSAATAHMLEQLYELVPTKRKQSSAREVAEFLTRKLHTRVAQRTVEGWRMGRNPDRIMRAAIAGIVSGREYSYMSSVEHKEGWAD